MKEVSKDVRFQCICFIAGIMNSKGVLWKEQRKFLHEKLRHFGMTLMGSGRQKMENRIMVSSYSFTIFSIQ